MTKVEQDDIETPNSSCNMWEIISNDRSFLALVNNIYNVEKIQIDDFLFVYLNRQISTFIVNASGFSKGITRYN